MEENMKMFKHLLTSLFIIGMLALNISFTNGNVSANIASDLSAACTSCTTCISEHCGGDRSYCGTIVNTRTKVPTKCYFDNQ